MSADHTARSRPMRPGDPRHLGRYELIGRLGEGGMGTVYLAQNPEGRHVAVKVVRSDLAGNTDFRRRFRREVERARQVPPFCTAEVLDADPEHDHPYLVVEYVDGPSLSAVVAQRGPLSSANLHGLAVGVATALTAIHGAGVIHRDLKPANVLLPPGNPKVIDFGIARAVQSTSAITRVDSVIGTLAYLAPERIDGSPGSTVTPATDVFAWGGVMTYAGTGRPPFPADAPLVMAAQIIGEPPVLDGLTEPLRELVERALAKNPADRPSARELLDWLLTAGPYRSRELAAALARQPALLVAAEGAQAAAGSAPSAEQARPGGSGPPAGGVAGGADPAGDDGTGLPAEPSSAEPAKPDRKSLSKRRSKRAERTERRTVRREVDLSKPVPRRRRGTFLAILVILSVLGAAAGVAAALLPTPRLLHPLVQPSFELPAAATTVVQDPLTAEGRWRTVEETAFQAKCSIAGGLVVTKTSPGPYRCAGTPPPMHNFVVTVDVQLGTPTSCAGIWFRFLFAGYALRVCRDGYHVVTHGRQSPTEVVEVGSFPDAGQIRLDTNVRVGVIAEGSHLRFFRDDRQVGELTDTSFGAGRVVLGVFPSSAQDAPPYRVNYANITVYSLPE